MVDALDMSLHNYRTHVSTYLHIRAVRNTKHRIVVQNHTVLRYEKGEKQWRGNIDRCVEAGRMYQ